MPSETETKRRIVRGTRNQDAPNAESTERKDPWYQLAEDAKYAALQALGQKDIPQPSNTPPELPSNIADIADANLMSLFVSFTRWSDFFSMQLAMDEVKEDLANKLVKKLESIFILSAPGKTAADKKAHMESDEAILAAREEHTVVDAHKTFVKVFYDNAVRSAAVCSRELSRRIEMESNSRRSDRNS
jgi:hypothetical protein